MRTMSGIAWFFFLEISMCANIAAAGGLRATDDLGKVLEFDQPPQRLVSLAPSNTELLLALGLGDRLVGVTNACNFPLKAKEVEVVAGYSTLNLEKIVEVAPDLVVAIRGNDLEGIKGLEHLGIKVFSLDIQTVDQMLLAILRLGILTGSEQTAEKLRGDLQGRINEVRERILSLAARPKIMWGGWSETVYTAGKGTMIDDLFRLAGGVNVGRAAMGAWPQVGLETIVAWEPEVIVTTYLPDAEGQTPEQVIASEVARLKQTDGWRVLPAVQQERIYFVEGDWLLRPGPRLVNALERIASLLHPDALGN